MTDIFLSYSSADRAAANAVQAALTARGYDVFWDQEVPAGQDWDDWIRGRLQAAKVCIVLWSKTSIASPNVRHEAMIARDGKRLIPAMIEPLKPADFPMGLYLVQSVQLNDWRDAGGPGMTRLMAEVAARLGVRDGAAAAVDVPKPARGGGPNIVVPLIAFAVVAALGAGGWYFSTQMKSGEVAAPQTVSADRSLPFSATMPGHFRWTGAMACADGASVTREGDGFVIVSPGSRFVHAIESDTPDVVGTRVTEPEFALGEQYEFHFVQDGTPFGGMTVKNMTAGTNETWTRCEVTP